MCGKENNGIIITLSTDQYFPLRQKELNRNGAL